jgi:uncharacterized BrkB/YihY/UPF0761 family membrane protein
VEKVTNPEYLFDLYRKAVTAWVDHFAPSMGAAISCYSMLSLVPLLIIAIAGVAAFGSWTPGLLPDWELLLQGVNVRVSIGITTACS